MQLVILAGGKGTRLGLSDIPKPMIKINNKPLLEHQIILAKQYGFKDIFILSGHLANVISDYFKDGSDLGINITHIIEPYPLGTAGSLKLLQNLIKDRFMVIYGDIMMDIDLQSFIEFDKKFNSIGTILVHPNDHPYDSDLVEIDRDFKITAFHSKPHNDNWYYKNLVNAAVYIFSPKIFEYIDTGKFQDFGKDILPLILNKNKILMAYHSSEYVKDIGTHDRFEKAENDFMSGKISRLNKKNKRKAIFLDRDGVINKDIDNLSNINDFKLLDNVTKAIKKINKSEYLVIIVTNQPAIAKGFISEMELYEIHKKMETLLGNENVYIDGLYYCPHHPDKGFEGEVKELKTICTCRKPEAGMILQAAIDFNIDLHNSWIIGDRETDMIAGKKAGCKTILVNKTIQTSNYSDYRFSDLYETIEYIY